MVVGEPFVEVRTVCRYLSGFDALRSEHSAIVDSPKEFQTGADSFDGAHSGPTRGLFSATSGVRRTFGYSNETREEAICERPKPLRRTTSVFSSILSWDTLARGDFDWFRDREEVS